MSSGAWLPREVPVRSRLVGVQWGRAFVVDVGPLESRLPPLVLLHDLFVTSWAFHDVIAGLGSGRRIVALDLPGCGDSDHPRPEQADDYALSWIDRAINEVLGALDVDRFDLVGQGFGATVALQLASHEAERVRRQVLVAPYVLTTELPLRGPPGLWPVLGVEVFRRAFRRSDLQRVLEQTVSTPELVREAAVNVYWDRLGRHGAREATHAMLEQIGRVARLRDQLESVRAPTLLVWGDADALVPPEDGERLATLLPRARLQVVDGCGHSVAEERPERLVALIEAHCSA